MAFPIGAEHEILSQGVATQLQTGRQPDRVCIFIYRKTEFQLAWMIRGDLEPAAHSRTIGSNAQISQGCHRIQAKIGAIGL